jgi:hypothetical protein
VNTASVLKGSRCPQIKSRLRHQSQESTVYELNFGTYTYIKTTLSWKTLGMRERMWENCTQTLAENSEDFPLNGESPETRKTRWRGAVIGTRSPFDLGQKGLRQGRSEKPRPTPEKSPQMRTDTGNTCALSWRNIATICEKQRMFLSCPDSLAVGPVFS